MGTNRRLYGWSRRRARLALVISAWWVLSIGLAGAAPVVELFTSQGCYSCPAADEFLAELIAAQPETVALEYHVDYWDDLVYGSAGVWKDPFSQAAFTRRQRAYNQSSLRGKRGVYTPQMIVNGNMAQVGSSKRAVLNALASDNRPPLDVQVSGDNKQIEIAIDGEGGERSQVWLAIFDRHHETDVVAGENKNKVMRNNHVVRSLTQVGSWRGEPLTIGTLALERGENHGCAVLVQGEKPGRILGAAYCP